MHDPAVANRVWLAYSWPHLRQGTAPGGGAVVLATVETHLARSDDGGATFTAAGELFPATDAADPEGSGEVGVLASETASLAWLSNGSSVTWFGARLYYFLRPITGYNPKFATGWVVQISTAASPDLLPAGPSTTLGVTNTASVYAPAARLDQLAGLSVQRCAILNNPVVFTRDSSLFLIVECLAFSGQDAQHGESTLQLFRTTPTGAPASWTWTYAGELAGSALIAQLGKDTIQQPDFAVAADGTPLLLVAPATTDAAASVGTTPDGCVALEISSFDPPALATDCTGQPIVRASVTGTGFGACAYNAHSATGILMHSQSAGGGNFRLRPSGIRP